jgi:hypothetical protein
MQTDGRIAAQQWLRLSPQPNPAVPKTIGMVVAALFFAARATAHRRNRA